MTTKSHRPTFRPALRATVIALPAFLVLLAMGSWQLDRLFWKTGVIDFREARLAAPAVPLPAVLPAVWASDPEALADLDHRRVTARGSFLHDREIYLAATRNGRVGFQVITPLVRGDGTALLVSRGWVLSDARDPAARANGQVEGVVTIEGILRPADKPGWLTPDNDIERNYWFWRDIAAMARFARVEAPPLLLEAGPAPNPGGLPVGRDYVVNIRNDHLQYAITWYLLAIALAVIYVLSQRRPPDEAN